MTADGWKPTPLGLQYFKYNRHEFRVEYPVKAARPIGNKFVGQQKRWQFDREYNENQTQKIYDRGRQRSYHCRTDKNQYDDGE